MAIGVPGWPELACWTASIASVRMVLMLSVSRSVMVSMGVTGNGKFTLCRSYGNPVARRVPAAQAGCARSHADSRMNRHEVMPLPTKCRDITNRMTRPVGLGRALLPLIVFLVSQASAAVPAWAEDPGPEL